MQTMKHKNNPIQLPTPGYVAARECGVSPAYISQILNGKRTPSLPLAAKIAAHMGVRIDTLYKRIVARQAQSQQTQQTQQAA